MIFDDVFVAGCGVRSAQGVFIHPLSYDRGIKMPGRGGKVDADLV